MSVVCENSVCVHVCAFVDVCVHLCVCVCAFVDVCVHLWVCVCICGCMRVHKYIPSTYQLSDEKDWCRWRWVPCEEGGYKNLKMKGN